MDDATPTSDTHVYFSSSYVTDDQFARKVTSATLRILFLRPARLIPLIVVVVCFLFVLLSSLALPSSGGDISPLVLITVVLVLVIGLNVLAFRRITRRVAQRLPSGSMYTLELLGDRMIVGQPLAKSELSYKLFRSIAREGEWVRFVQRIARTTTLLPFELFTPESFDWLAARISGQTSPDTARR